MTTEQKFEAIWEQQTPGPSGIRHPIQYERCGHANGWRFYMQGFDGNGKIKPGGPDAIVSKGKPSIREAIDAAFEELFPPTKEKGESDA